MRIIHLYFCGNAQVLKQMEMTEAALRDNAKVVITEHGIHPTLLLGSLPISGNGAVERQYVP